MTILEVIKNDHDRMRALLGRLLNNVDSDREKRTDLIRRIRDEVIPHARAEEAVLYNGMRAADAPTDMVYHGFKEHAETEVLLHTLETMDKLHADWEVVAKKLHDELIHHVDEEESDLFPQVKAAFTTEELTEMAEIFKEMKPEIREQGAFQQTLEMVGNLIPPKVTEMFKGDSSAK